MLNQDFFRVVLTSKESGNNKTFTINYGNNPKYQPGKKCYMVVEHFSTIHDDTLNEDCHLFLSLPQTNNYDNFNNVSKHILSILSTPQDNNYRYFYNMGSLENGLNIILSESITVTLKTLNQIVNTTSTNYFDMDDNDIIGFTLILRFYSID